MTHPADISPDDPLAWLSAELVDLARANLLRSPMEVTSRQGTSIGVRDRDGVEHRWVNFCSNNYLNLAGDPRIARAACEAIEQWGFGSGASRLISGTTSLHRQAERKLAEFLGTDDAVLLGTGYQTNVAAVTALAGEGDTVLLDKLDHASLIDAARQCGARIRVYPHGDVDRLAELLGREQATARRIFVVTDSLFSMDGDFAPLVEIVGLKRRHRFTLVVDEAHAIGIFGPRGRGIAELLGVSEGVDVIVGTASKALGGVGGFIAGKRVLIDALRNLARPFIFSTAPPAAAAAAVIAALRIVREEPERRERLLALCASLRQKLRAAQLISNSEFPIPNSQILPIVYGTEERALAAQRILLEHAQFAVAIRPPTVPRGTARIRISLMCDHTEADLDRLTEALLDAQSRLA
ncbi:MAG: 8-amino-7-oxononanoate synthase [Phycisphaerae bacterium]|nr:8-amino-7-oxononanoate synthase [Phycisphaerae bacterium]